MVDRENIQRRLDALGLVEQARRLAETGDVVGASQHVDQALELAPDLSEARAFRHELDGQKISSDVYRRTSTLDLPTEADGLLHEIEQARRNEDWERVPVLSEVLLATGLPGPQTNRINDCVAEACYQLVERTARSNLEVALGWATTWHRLTHQPTAKQMMQHLRSRIEQVQHHQDALLQAMASSELPLLQQALAFFDAQADRLATTAEAVSNGRAELERRQRRCTEILSQLDQVVPDRLDLACRLMDELCTIHPGEANQRHRQDLHRRAKTVLDGEVALRQALGRNAIGDIKNIQARLQASADRLQHTDALLLEAEKRLSGLESQLVRLQDQYDRSLSSDLEAAIEAADQIARLAPADARAGELGKLKRRLTSARQAEEELEELIDAEACPNELLSAADELDRSNTQLATTARVVQRARSIAAQRRLRTRRLWRITLIIAALIGIPILVATGLYMRDASIMRTIHLMKDDQAKVAALRAYTDHDFHVFGRDDARRQLTNLLLKLDQQSFDRTKEVIDTDERVAALREYLHDYPEGRYRTQAQAEIDRIALARQKMVWDRARSIEDPELRLPALLEYVRSYPEGAWNDECQALIEATRIAIDEKAWAQIDRASSLDERRAWLLVYLERPFIYHGEEARAQLGELEQAQAAIAVAASQRERLNAVERIDDPRARRQGLVALLEELDDPDTVRAARAHIARLDRAYDDERWRQARSPKDPSMRFEALQGYLDGDWPAKAHEEDARTAMDAAQRALDDAAWQQVLATKGERQGRIAAARAYLESESAVKSHRQDAEDFIAQQRQYADQEAWRRAIASADPTRLLRGLYAYLDGDTIKAYEQEARRRIRVELNEIRRLSPELIGQTIPPDIILRLGRETIDRIPNRYLIRLTELPAARLASVDVAILARIADTHLADLPVRVLARIERQPPWAIAAGADSFGRWADLHLADYNITLRFRYVFPARADASTALQQGLWLADREVDQHLYTEVYSSRNPSLHRGRVFPIEYIDWRRALDFIEGLNDACDDENIPARLRLPHLIELRFVHRVAIAGPMVDDYPVITDGLPADFVPDRVWYAAVSSGTTCAVDEGRVDGYGLYHLYGNVAEWTADRADNGDDLRWAMGGSFALGLDDCAPGRAVRLPANTTSNQVGLRLVIETSE